MLKLSSRSDLSLTLSHSVHIVCLFDSHYIYIYMYSIYNGRRCPLHYAHLMAVIGCPPPSGRHVTCSTKKLIKLGARRIWQLDVYHLSIYSGSNYAYQTNTIDTQHSLCAGPPSNVTKFGIYTCSKSSKQKWSNKIKNVLLER